MLAWISRAFPRIMLYWQIYLYISSMKHVTHSEKKGYQNGALGVLLLQMVPFFQRGTLFSLIIMFMKKRVPLRDRGTIHKNSTPRGTVCPISTLFRKSGTILVPFLPEGYCFGAKKGRKKYPFFRGALKRYPFFRGVLFQSKKRSKTVPLWKRVPF